MANSFDRQQMQAAWRLLKTLGRKTPEFRMLTRQRIQTPKGYSDWAAIAVKVAAQCATFRECYPMLVRQSPENFSQYVASSISMHLAHINAPKLWLSKELLQAFLNTEVPRKTGAIKRPFEGGFVMLPKGVVMTPDAEPVDFIGFAHILKGDSSSVQINGTTIQFAAAKFDQLQVFTVTDDQTVYAGSLEIVLEDGRLSLEDRQGNGWQPCPIISEDKSNPAEIEIAFLRSLESLVLQVVLLAQFKPELVDGLSDDAAATRRRQSKPANTRKPVAPRWIGRSYRMQRESAGDAEQEEIGSHSSPITHYRRGHWQSYPLGSRAVPLPDRPRIWHWKEPIRYVSRKYVSRKT